MPLKARGADGLLGFHLFALAECECMAVVNKKIFVIPPISRPLLQHLYYTCLYHNADENTIYHSALILLANNSSQTKNILI